MVDSQSWANAMCVLAVIWCCLLVFCACVCVWARARVCCALVLNLRGSRIGVTIYDRSSLN